MSTYFKIDVRTINLELKLGNKVSNIIWYITNSENDLIRFLPKHPNDNKHKFFVFLRRNTPEIDTILQRMKIPNNIIYIPQEQSIASLPIAF